MPQSWLPNMVHHKDLLSHGHDINGARTLGCASQSKVDQGHVQPFRPGWFELALFYARSLDSRLAHPPFEPMVSLTYQRNSRYRRGAMRSRAQVAFPAVGASICTHVFDDYWVIFHTG